MSELIVFIKENMRQIVIVVIIVLFMLVVINIKGLDLNEPKPDSKLVQQVTVETFDNDDENLVNDMLNSANNFCKSFIGDSNALEQSCNTLTRDNCANVECCVLDGTKNKCVAGDINGPTYKTTSDNYYYLGKCLGRCPS